MNNTSIETSIYLPGIFSSNESKPEIISVPVFSEELCKIFSDIQPTIPNSQELMKTLKPIHQSVTEITSAVNSLNSSKKNEFLRKAGSGLGTLAFAAVSTVLLTAAAVGIIFSSSIFFGIIAPVFGIGGGLVTLGVATFLGSMFYLDYHQVSKDQKKLDLKLEEVKTNYAKFKAYFTKNFKEISNKLKAQINEANEEVMRLKNSPIKNKIVEKEIEQKIETLKKAQGVIKQVEELKDNHKRLENLHHFFQK